MFTATKTRLGLGLLAGLLCLTAGASAALASPRLHMSVVLARRAPGPVDPALRPMQAHLKKSFSEFKSFKEIATHELALQKGKPSTVTLPNRKQARFDYKGREGAEHRIALTIDKTKLDLRTREKVRFYQAGLKYKDGVLIVVVHVTK